VSLKWSLGYEEGRLQLAKEQAAYIVFNVGITDTTIDSIEINFIYAYIPLPKFANKLGLDNDGPLLVLVVVYCPFLLSTG